VIVLRRLELVATARVACLYAPDAFRDGGEMAARLPLLFGRDAAGEVARELWSTAGRQASRAALERATGWNAARALGVALKRAGVEACSRRTLGKLAPVVGAVGGAIAGARDVRRGAERALAHFEDGRRLRCAAAAAPRLAIVPPPAASAERAPPRASSGRRAALAVAVAAIRAGDALAAAARNFKAASAARSAAPRAHSRSERIVSLAA
jgi:hypothetical protein